MFHETLTMTGALAIAINGEIVKEVPNLVVTTGKNYVASRMKDTTEAVMSHMAVGTSATAAAVGDTTLGVEVERNTLTSTTVTNNAVTYVAGYAAGEGTGAITEAGLFNAASNGTMLCRTVFDVVNKGPLDAMTVTWVVSVS